MGLSNSTVDFMSPSAEESRVSGVKEGLICILSPLPILGDGQGSSLLTSVVSNTQEKNFQINDQTYIVYSFYFLQNICFQQSVS